MVWIRNYAILLTMALAHATSSVRVAAALAASHLLCGCPQLLDDDFTRTAPGSTRVVQSTGGASASDVAIGSDGGGGAQGEFGLATGGTALPDERDTGGTGLVGDAGSSNLQVEPGSVGGAAPADDPDGSPFTGGASDSIDEGGAGAFGTSDSPGGAVDAGGVPEPGGFPNAGGTFGTEGNSGASGVADTAGAESAGAAAGTGAATGGSTATTGGTSSSGGRGSTGGWWGSDGWGTSGGSSSTGGAAGNASAAETGGSAGTSDSETGARPGRSTS